MEMIALHKETIFLRKVKLKKATTSKILNTIAVSYNQLKKKVVTFQQELLEVVEKTNHLSQLQ